MTVFLFTVAKREKSMLLLDTDMSSFQHTIQVMLAPSCFCMLIMNSMKLDIVHQSRPDSLFNGGVTKAFDLQKIDR